MPLLPVVFFCQRLWRIINFNKHKRTEELIYLIRQGNVQAFLKILSQYEGFFYAITGKYCKEHKIPSMYFDDMIDISVDCFKSAIRNYMLGNGSFFNYFWGICMKRFASFIRDICQDSVSLDDSFNELSHRYFMTVKDVEKVEKRIRAISYIVEEHISEFERNELLFLQFTLLGFSAAQIKKIFEWSTSRTYRYRNSVIDKISKYIKTR